MKTMFNLNFNGMNNTNKKATKMLRAWIYALVLLILPFISYSQVTFDVEAFGLGTTSDPSVDYIVSEDDLTAKIINVAGQTATDDFYFYYVDNGDPSDLVLDRIISGPQNFTTTERTFTGVIDETGTFDLWVAYYSGRFDYETVLDNSHVANVIGGEGTLTAPMGNVSATYTMGDIPTDYNNFPSSCPAYLSVTIPDGATILGVDVEYEMTAQNIAYKSEQRSQIACMNPGGTAEGSYYSGTGTGGTQAYNRSGLNIANGVAGGGEIVFMMDAWREWGNAVPNNGCSTYYNRVDDNTWTVTVHYVENPVYDFPFTFDQSGNRSLETEVIDLSGETAGDVLLEVDFNFLPNDTHPVIVQYSTNGTTWTNLAENGGGAEEEFSSDLGMYTPVFELPAGALNANAQFRLRQLNAAGLAPFDQDWEINSMAIYKGTVLTQEEAQSVGTYNVITDPGPPAPPVPTLSIVDVQNEDAVSVTGWSDCIMPGTEFTVFVETTDIDPLADYTYLLAINGQFIPDTYIINTDLDDVNDEIEFTVEMPVDWVSYYDSWWNDIEVYAIDGTDIDYGAGGIVDEELMVYNTPVIEGATWAGPTSIDFDQAGARSVTSDVLEVLQDAGASLIVTISRLSEQIPPVGQEIAVEFTTDGTTWTQIGDLIELGGVDGVGMSGETFMFDETDLAGITSATTQFRVRQLAETNGAGIHTWNLDNFRLTTLGTNNNIMADDWYSVCFDEPSFGIELTDADMDPLYPGSTFDVSVIDIEGTFPAFTVFEVYYDDIWLETLTTLADFDVELPLDNGYKTLSVRAEAGDWNYEADLNFTIQPVGLEITDISYDVEDDGTQYNIPGEQMDVTYTFHGDMDLTNIDASVILQIDNGGTWETIAVQAITNTIISNAGGVISGNVPQYAYGADTDVRVYIENTPWTEGHYQNNILSRWGEDDDYDFDGNYYYEYGSYSTTIMEDSKIGFNIFVDEDFEGDLEFWYYVAGEPEPVVFGTPITITAGTWDYASHYNVMSELIDIPAELEGNSYADIWFGVRHDNELANVWLGGIRLIEPRIVQTGADASTINVLYPSVALSTMETEYEFGEAITLQYSTYGIVADPDLWFAITLEQEAGTPGHVYHVLGESQSIGEVDVDITFPTSEELDALGFNTADPFYARVYAYTQDTYNELFVATTQFGLTLNDDDFMAIEGYDDGAGEFNSQDDRYAITKALDLSDLNEPVYLHFGYDAGIWVYNEITLPYLQVSVDGGVTYTTINVPESEFASIDRLDAVGSYNYSVEIDPMYLTESTYFRWIQDASSNYDDNVWDIYDIMITTGESNLVDFAVEYIPEDYEFDLVEPAAIDPYADYDNINTYEWNLIDPALDPALDPVITVGEEFEYEWMIETDLAGDPIDVVWPTGTEFEFYIIGGDGNTNNPDNYILFGTETATGTFNSTLAEDVALPTGYYEVYAMAWIYEGADRVHGVPGYIDYDVEDPEWNLPAIYKNWVFIVNETANVNPLNLTLNSPEDTDEFMLNETFDMNYSTFGEWPTDVKFAAVIKAEIDAMGNEEVQVLGESALTGENQVIAGLTMPEFPMIYEDGSAINDYQVGVIAFQGDELVLPDVEIAWDNEDLLGLEGYSNLDPWIEFSEEGTRQAMTEVVDLTVYDAPYLEFSIYVDAATMETISTLPQLMVSTDGGASFDLIGIFEADGVGWSYMYPIDPMYITDQTQFKFVQPINNGQFEDFWALRDVAITAGTNNVYEGKVAYADVVLNRPAIANYDWSLVPDIYGFDPVIYNGSEFEFNWAVGTDLAGDPLPEFPAGTEFEFVLWDGAEDEAVIDVETGNEIVLATTDAPGTYSSTVPFYVERNNYLVKAFAYNDDMLYDADIVGNLNVFNEVLQTVYHEVNPVLFAGEDATFSAQLENTLNPSNYDDVWFSLLLDYDGETWVLDAHQGLADNFDIQLPPFVNGNRDFAIIATDNQIPTNAIGIVEDFNNTMVLDGTDFDMFMYGGNYVVSNAMGQMGELYTNELDVAEYESIEFQVKVSEDMADLTEEQKMVFAYSVDGGVTYTDLATYPDARFTDPLFFDNEDLEDWFNEMIALPVEAQTDATIFRWRVEESNGTMEVGNIELRPTNINFNILPLVFIETEVEILPQRIDITATDALAYCKDDVIELTYNIRGRFADGTIMYPNSNAGNLEIDGEDIFFEGITEGTGTVQINNGSLDNPLEGTNIRFNLEAEDEAVEDYDYTIWGNWSEIGVGIVPEINDTEVFAMVDGNTEHESCEATERIVVLTDVQENFEYQLRNYVTGDLIGDAVLIDVEDEDLMDDDIYPIYDPMNDRLEISIGTITEEVVVDVMIKSHDAEGLLECQTLVPNSQATFDIRPAYTLHSDLNNTGVWTPVTDGQAFEICQGSEALEFSMGYWKDGNYNMTGADWYKNDMTHPMGSHWTYSEMMSDGNYFAFVDDGDCGEYQSVEYSITVVPVPEQPEITVNGEAFVCEGETVSLSATEGYNYYKWYLDGNAWGMPTTQTIDVTVTGTYTVEVSNVPFVQACHSEISNPVYIEIFEFNQIMVTNNVTLCPTGDGIAEIAATNLQDDVTYHLINDGTGVDFGQTFSGSGGINFNTLPITESTVLSIKAVSNVNPDCEKMMDQQIVVMIDEDVKTMYRVDNVWETVESGDTYTSCEDEIALSISKGDNNDVHWLEADETVIWYKDGEVYQTMTQWNDNYLYPTVSGVYHAKYINNNTQEVCSYLTEAIDITITAKPERPEITYTGNLEFCEGSEELVLTAPAGYDQYEWYLNGGMIANNTSSNNELVATMTGDYTVRVAMEDACQSETSTIVSVNVIEKPEVPVLTAIDAMLCEPGMAYVMVVNAEDDVMYQLYDVITGEASGDARMGSANLVLQSAEIAENTVFEVRAWRINANTCSAVSMPIEIGVNTVTVDVSANTLIAVASNPNEVISYQWYRNGLVITNGGDDNMLNIYDDAEYMVVVTTVDGCVIESVINRSMDDGNIDAEITNSMDIYPNPATDFINLNYSSTIDEDVTVRVIDVKGVVLYEVQLSKVEGVLEHQIFFDDWAKGTYVLQVIGQKNIMDKTFIKF
jgi:hypothetical protein